MKRITVIIILVLAAGMVLRAQEAKHEKTAKEYIGDLSSSGDEKMLLEAAKFLGDKKEKDAVPGLINLLTDRRENVRMESAVSLGLIAEESSVDALNNAMINDESADVRYASMLATMRIGSKKSIDAYKQLKEKESDPFIQDILKKMEEKVKGK